MADHPLRPATDRSPGRPLPHQLANRAQAHLVALPKRSFARCRAYAGLSAISRRYPSLKGRYPRVTHPSATRFLRSACDLHVLGTPPAFILSQDQTRNKFALRTSFLRKDALELTETALANSCCSVFHSSIVKVHDRQHDKHAVDLKINGVMRVPQKGQQNAGSTAFQGNHSRGLSTRSGTPVFNHV